MKRLELVALGTGVAALLLAAFALFAQLRESDVRGIHVASVVLEQPRNGTCQVVYKDNPIRAGRSTVILWAVDNRCDTPQEVSLTDFSPSNPLVRLPPPRSAPAGRMTYIPERVRANANYGAYKYAIALNKVVQTDPDIIIEYEP